MRLVFHFLFGFVTLIVIGAAWTSAVGTSRVAPVPIVVIALYLGLTSRGHLASAVAAAIAVGYCGDVLSGTPQGLFALGAALTAIVGHIAQGRFVLRGHILSAAVVTVAAALFLWVTAALSRAVGIDTGASLPAQLVAASAALTAVVGPVQLALHRRIDARLARTQRERDATLEGVASA